MQSLLFSIILYPLFYIFPAYVANGSPVIFGGGMAIDMGKKFMGKPIFGSHKTIRGLIFGIASGLVLSLLESMIPGYSYMLVVGAALTIGTQFGDLLGSFIKRRIGRKEGARFVLMDQYLFLVFALIFAYPVGNMPPVMPTVYGLIFIFILTGILHVVTNRLAHKANIKKVPW